MALHGSGGTFWALRARQDSSVCLAANENGTVLELSVSGNSIQNSFVAPSPLLYAAAYSRDDTYFALAGSDGNVYVYDATDRINNLV